MQNQDHTYNTEHVEFSYHFLADIVDNVLYMLLKNRANVVPGFSFLSTAYNKNLPMALERALLLSCVDEQGIIGPNTLKILKFAFIEMSNTGIICSGGTNDRFKEYMKTH